MRGLNNELEKINLDGGVTIYLNTKLSFSICCPSAQFLSASVTGTAALRDVWLKALKLLSQFSAASPCAGPCQALLHLAKLTRLLGSPETWHLADLLTVSLLQITPSLSALITCIPCLSQSFPSITCFCTSHFLLPFCTIHCHSPSCIELFSVSLLPVPDILTSYPFLTFFTPTPHHPITLSFLIIFSSCLISPLSIVPLLRSSLHYISFTQLCFF